MKRAERRSCILCRLLGMFGGSGREPQTAPASADVVLPKGWKITIRSEFNEYTGLLESVVTAARGELGIVCRGEVAAVVIRKAVEQAIETERMVPHE